MNVHSLNTLPHAFVALFLLSGCATPPAPVPVVSPQVVRLEKTAVTIERMLAEMNALERSRMQQPGQWKAAVDVLPPNHPLMKKTTAVLAGDIRLVLRRLADQFGMDLMVKGKPLTQVHVSISAYDQPFVSIIESIGAQAGNVVDITCDTGQNLLTIEYR